jgi:hypothetical protein
VFIWTKGHVSFRVVNVTFTDFWFVGFHSPFSVRILAETFTVLSKVLLDIPQSIKSDAGIVAYVCYEISFQILSNLSPIVQLKLHNFNS